MAIGHYSNEEYSESNLWALRKMELLDGIDAAMEEGRVDTDVLNLMREIVNNCKVKISMRDLFEEEDY